MEIKRSLRVVAKHQESDDTATFILEATDGRPFKYLPGQYLSLVFDTPGGEKRRAYSFSSCPGVDALPAITVKRVPNGEFSNYLLRHVAPGDMVRSTEANGRFVLPSKLPRNLVYIAAGSGITPILSQIKYLLETTGHSSRIVLYYASRDSRSTLFKKQIDGWMERFPDRFECLYFFSREKNAAHALFRHLNNELLENLLVAHFQGKITAKQRKSTLFYLCAPKALMRMAEMTLRTLGFADEQIIRETFVPDTRMPTREIDTSKIHRIVASGKGEHHEFSAYEGETILNAALRQGIALPYTCKSGVCFTCLARCQKGQVDVVYVENTRREGPGDMVNTCIGYAVTEQVVLFYE